MEQTAAKLLVMEATWLRSRRQIIFRPSGSQSVPVGTEALFSVHMVDGNGTTIALDGASEVTFGVQAGPAVIVTPQPVRFSGGVARVVVGHPAPGGATIEIVSAQLSGPIESGATLDITDTKAITN